jgi:hypothetical protein
MDNIKKIAKEGPWEGPGSLAKVWIPAEVKNGEFTGLQKARNRVISTN